VKQLAVEIFVSYLPIWLGGLVWIVTTLRDRFPTA
jgi:hypothetical protein